MFCFLTFSGTVFCQTQAEAEKYVNMIRQDLQAEKIQLITKNMEFTVEESSAFWPVYEKYQQEFRKIGDEKVALMKDYATHYDHLDDAKAMELANKAVQLDGMRVDLMKKYLPGFSKVLSGKRVARFVQVENQINRLIDLKIGSETPLVP